MLGRCFCWLCLVKIITLKGLESSKRVDRITFSQEALRLGGPKRSSQLSLFQPAQQRNERDRAYSGKEVSARNKAKRHTKHANLIPTIFQPTSPPACPAKVTGPSFPSSCPSLESSSNQGQSSTSSPKKRFTGSHRHTTILGLASVLEPPGSTPDSFAWFW